MAEGAGESALTVADDACVPLGAPESIGELDGYTPDALAAAAADCLSQPGPADTVEELVLTLPAQPSTRPQPAAAALPGVPLPKRGTSPVPA